MVARGITLVELIVGIAMMSILTALLIPAVQHAREGARAMACRNNLRQIAISIHQHETAHRHLPTGGWGWRWQGDPDRGFRQAQPGGWIYGLLPFIEQSQLREIGIGYHGAARAQELERVAATPLALFVCPSRRGPKALPFVHKVGFINMSRPQLVARSDYAACSGDAAPDFSRGKGRGPRSLQEGDGGFYRWLDTNMSGVVFRRSQTRLADITSGLSNTYMVGEKYLSRQSYLTGKSQNDDQHMLVGFDIDTLRTTDPSYPPLADEKTITSDHAFGSAHADAFNMAMAEGSVHVVSYRINREIYRAAGNRAR